jgi:Fe(3+) dicitrate transport protein
MDIARALGSLHSVIVGLTATVVSSRYAASRYIHNGEQLVDVRHHKLPYAPSLVMNQYLGVSLKNGFGVHVYGYYSSKQFSDELNTVIPYAHGLTGVIESRYSLDGTLQYTFTNQKIALFTSCKNLTNERYIASRRPQGIKVGLPRFISAGINVTF